MILDNLPPFYRSQFEAAFFIILHIHSPSSPFNSRIRNPDPTHRHSVKVLNSILWNLVLITSFSTFLSLK